MEEEEERPRQHGKKRQVEVFESKEEEEEEEDDNRGREEEEGEGEDGEHKGKRRSKQKVKSTIIVMCDPLTGAIGKEDDQFPWKTVPEEARRYVSSKIKETKDPSKRNAVIIGGVVFAVHLKEQPFGLSREEVEKDPSRKPPLTCVLSRTLSLLRSDTTNLLTAPTYADLCAQISEFDDVEHIYILGGSYTFKAAMQYCNDMHILFYSPSDPDDIYDDYDHRIAYRDRFVEKDPSRRLNLAEGLQIRFFVRSLK